MQPPVIRVNGNVYVLAGTVLDQYKGELNQVATTVHRLAADALAALDKAKLGPANTLLQRSQERDRDILIDAEDTKALDTFMKFWNKAIGVLGPLVGEFKEVPFEEGQGRDLQNEEQERSLEEDDEYDPFNRYSSTLGGQLVNAYSYSLEKLDEAVSAFSKLLPLMQQWDAIAKQTAEEDPSKAGELSDVLNMLMEMRDAGSKLADLAMSADYMALQPQQTHATTANSDKPSYKFVSFPRFIRVGGNLYSLNTEKTEECLVTASADQPEKLRLNGHVYVREDK